MHIVGLWLLHGARFVLQNQRLITINLAIAEVLYGLYGIFYALMEICRVKYEKWILADGCLDQLIGTTMKLIMLHIILDRFLDISLNIKYNIYLNETRLIQIMCILWALSFASMIVFLVVVYEHDFEQLLDDISYASYFRLTLDIIIIICAVSTYVYFYVTIQNMNNGRIATAPMEMRVDRKRQRKMLRAKFITPCLVVTTYIIFNVSATVLWASMPDNFIMINIGWLLTAFGIVSDALIYIFTQKRIRNQVLPVVWPMSTASRNNSIFPVDNANGRDKKTSKTLTKTFDSNDLHPPVDELRDCLSSLDNRRDPTNSLKTKNTVSSPALRRQSTYF